MHFNMCDMNLKNVYTSIILVHVELANNVMLEFATLITAHLSTRSVIRPTY